MKGLDLSRRTAALIGGIVLLLGGAGAGVGFYLHGRPVLNVTTTAQECISAPDHVASLFSNDQSTLIRFSSLDYSDIRVLRTEPASTLPGMFDALLAVSGDSRRLAYVTAGDPLMDDAHIQYVDVAAPQTVHPVVAIPSGLTPVRPAWSPDRDQLAYVVGRPAAAGAPAGFEVWSARVDGSQPSQKIADLPVTVFARGHSASLCWTAGGQISLLQGIESAAGPPAPTPLTGPGAVSAPRTQTPEPTATPNGSPCGVPIFSQNDPSWRSTIMQAGGDPIGGFGCALTSTTMLLNYYGATMSPVDLNACLGPSADPIYWSSAPGCTAGRVSGGLRTDFSWEALDAFLEAGRPVIVGLLRGQTGSHFVVVTQGGGGEADRYRITDPWDGSTTKTLGSYTNTGYNPRWIITYDGAGKNCARLVASTGQSVQGFRDGGTYKGGVTVNVPSGSDGDATVQTPDGTIGPGTSPSPSPSASPSESPSPSPSTSPSASPSASPSPSPSASPPGKLPVWRIRPGGKLTFTQDGVYLIYIRHPGPPPHVSILKFTIDRTPPVLTLLGLNRRPGISPSTSFGHGLGVRMADSPTLVLAQPGQLRLGAVDTLSGVDHIDYSLDGSPVASYSDDVSFRRTITVAALGTHVVSVHAEDIAGNVSDLVDQPFEVVDTTPTPSPSPSPTPTPTPRRTPTPTAVPPTPTPTPTPLPLFTITASASPANLTTTACPATITFTAVVNYRGTAEASFRYSWLRSDGGIDTSQSFVSFSGPGQQTVTRTWLLGNSSDPSFHPFHGWQQVQLQVTPNNSVFSNQANFTLTCNPSPSPTPGGD